MKSCLKIYAGVLIIGSMAGAQTSPSTTQQMAPQQSNPGMLSGQSNGTLLGPQKTNAGTVMAPAMTGGVLDVERMTHEQFRALADTAIVRYRGQNMTKGAYIQQRLNVRGGVGTNTAKKPPMSFEQARLQFQQKQKAELDAQNARVQAVMDRMTASDRQVQSSPRYVSLSKEASEIQRKYASAPPDERSRLKARALRVHEELKKLENGE